MFQELAAGEPMPGNVDGLWDCHGVIHGEDGIPSPMGIQYESALPSDCAVFQCRQGSTCQSKRTIRGAAAGRTGLQAAQGRRVGGGKNAGTREAREQQAWILY